MDSKLPIRGKYSNLPSPHEGLNYRLVQPVYQNVRSLHVTTGAAPSKQSPATKIGWTSKEDYTILELRRRETSWKEISRYVKGRSPNDCWARHNHLKNDRQNKLAYVCYPVYDHSVQEICSHC
jgi:hypothetical protein